jgi:hypothetical protein
MTPSAKSIASVFDDVDPVAGRADSRMRPPAMNPRIAAPSAFRTASTYIERAAR